MKVRLPLAAAAIAVSGGLVFSACSSSGDHSSMTGDSAAMEGSTTTTAAIPADADFNATDAGFAQGMIPHHGQAVEMAEMALDKSGNGDVVALATAIKAAQQPEIDQLSGWLDDWGQTVPSADMGADHDMSGTDGMMMGGMMSAADMQRLEEAEGAEFDVTWMEMMILHHEGAIDMANDELAGGKSVEAKQLAESIIEAQQAEIAQMEALLAGSPA